MKIAFICKVNSARSQMAEGYSKHFARLYFPSSSVHPLTVKAMQEKGIDISSQYPKTIESIPYKELDMTINLCGDAVENCPYALGTVRYHWGLEGPTKEGTIEAFRKVRYQLKQKVEDLIKNL